MIVNACWGEPICLGYETENDVEAVVFDKSAWIAAYGPGTFELVHKRRQDSSALPVAVDVSGGVVTWTITAADVAYRGAGEAQLRYYNAAGQIKASEIYRTQVSRSLVSDPDVPSPLEGWVEQVLAAAAGIQNMQADAVTLTPGSAATVTKTVDPDTGVVTLTFGIPEGLKGDTGRGIAYMSVLSTGEWQVVYTDGTSETVGYNVYSALEMLLRAAQEAAGTASDAAGTAQSAATSAASSAANAADSAESAATSAENAERDASSASSSAQSAQEAQTAAAASASSASASASSASSAKTAAQSAQTAAESARDRAETAAQTLVLDPTLTSPTQAAQAEAAGNAVKKVQDIIDTDYAALNEYSVAVSTSSKYGSNGVKFEKGKVYKIHVTASGWTASSSGTYAFVLRTTNFMVGNSTEWDANVVETILSFKKADLDISGNVDVVKDFIPSQNALYLSYFVRSGQNTTCTMSVEVLSGEQASKKTELNSVVQFPRSLFYRNTVYNGETYASNSSYAASKELYFPEAAWIESPSALVKVYFLGVGATGYSNRVLIPPESRVIVNISANAATRGAAIDNIKVYTTSDGKIALENSWRFRLADTTRLPGSDRQLGGLYVADANERGLSHAYGSYQKNVTYPYVFVADKDLTIYVARYYSTTGYIVSANGGTLIASLEQEKRYTIPAGTEFLITLLSEYSGEATTQLGANLVFTVADENENLSPFTLPFNTTIRAARVDTAFCDSNGVFYYISGEDKNNVYYVVENGVVTATNSFDGPTGHANSCCYRNGLVYISPWTTKNKLYVYTVDETEKTLTYTREITIPVADGEGATEYYVCDDDEKQIVSMGMRSANTLMKYTLWVKHESTYVEARSILIPMMDEQAGWIQSFTMAGKYVLYIMGHDDYTHLGYGVLDTTTGILKVIPTTSDTASVEIEALIPVGKNLFIAVSNAGKQYAQYIRLE